MSIEEMCKTHRVQVFNLVPTTGAEMGIRYTSTDTGRTLDCNAQRVDADLSLKYMARGMKTDWEVFFSADPVLTTSNILKLGSEYLRVLGIFPETDFDGVDQLWVVPCQSVTQQGDAT